MTDGLAEYVRGDTLYGRVSGGWFGSGMPALTVGALLLRLHRLQRLHETASLLTAAQAGELTAVQARHDAIAKEWAVHYAEKADREVRSRLKAMDAYFAEMQDEPRTAVSNYLPEALRRTTVQALLVLFPTPDTELKSALRKADGGLRRWTEPGPFLWAAELEPVYPQPEYWWLYAQPVMPPKARG